MSVDKDLSVKKEEERQEDDSDFVLVVNRKKNHSSSESHGYYKNVPNRKYDDHEYEYRRRRSADHRAREFRDNSSGSRGHRKNKARERERSENSYTRNQQPQNGAQNKENVNGGVIKSFSLVVAGGGAGLESFEDHHQDNKKLDTVSIPTSSNDTASLTSEETNESVRNEPILEFVEAPPPPVNPWFKNKRNNNQTQQQVKVTTNKPNTAMTQKQTQNVQKQQDQVKAKQPTAAVSPQRIKEVHTNSQALTQTNSQSSVASHKGPDIAQPRETSPIPQVYYREMANGFRPGRGRGSYSASAARTIPSRSQVLSQIKSSVKINNANEDWPSLGEAIKINPEEHNADAGKNEITQQTAQIYSQSTTANPSKPAVGVIESASDNERVSTSSDDDNDESRNGLKRRPSKQRWVPLDITEPEPSDQRSKSKGSKHTRDTRHHQSRSKGKENVMNGHSDYSDYERLNNNRMRGNGYRGRGGQRGGMRRHHNMSRNSLNMINGIEVLTGSEFNDYPHDFTTLTPMYPAVSEFIMPYVANGYFPTPFSPPPTVLVEHEPIPIASVVPLPVAPVDNVALLIDLVRTQIEYYFSAENLEKDFYLRRKMDSDGYLPVHLIATFPRVKNMTQEYSIVISAIQGSENLELKPDLSSVRTRINPGKWPLPDHSAVINASVSSIDKESSSRVNNNEVGSESLNPNVPEFVPQQQQINSVAY